MIPSGDEALLTRDEAAKLLTEAGYKTSKKTLDVKACRGGGPVYVVYGKRALYRRGTLLAWARAQVSLPMGTATEHRAARLSEGAAQETPVARDRRGDGPGRQANTCPNAANGARKRLA